MTEYDSGLPETLRSLSANLAKLAKAMEVGGAEDENKGEGYGEALGRTVEACRAALDEIAAALPSSEPGDSKILVVDDDEVSLGLMADFLGRFGEVVAVPTGSDAVAVVTKAVRTGSQFRIIFLDLMMPEMDGHEVLRRIRGVEEVYSIQMPATVAMTTAMGDRDTVLRARQGGSEGYFVKPIDLAKLGEWVEAQLQPEVPT